MSSHPAGDADREVGGESRSETEEELRVAFEELQALTEDLEQANSSLQLFNTQLEERVAARTREIADANATLRRSETALQAVANVVPDLLWRTDTIGYMNWANRRWSDLTGRNVDEILGAGWLSVLHEDDREAAAAAFARARAEGSAFQQEHRLLDKNGRARWFLARIEPMHDDRGQIVQWFGAAMDMHDQRVSLEALQQSEARLSTLIGGMPQLVWRSADRGRWTWSSRQWQATTAQSLEQSLEEGWLVAFHPDDRAIAMAAWANSADSGKLAFEGRIFSQAEGRYRYFQTRALPVRDEQGAVLEWLGTSTDIDDLVSLQNEQTVLVSELQHRTRNLMAVMQAVITKTLKSSANFKDFTVRIGDRMQALARVQGLLSNRAAGTRIAFDKLLKEELSAHASLDDNGNAAQITLSGQEGILLRSSTIQTFALALHELATNAVKYGALSSPDGHLCVNWDVVDADKGDPRLAVHWRETGVANVPFEDNGASARFGYGRELIERALPYQLGAHTTYRFRENGLECSIEVRVPDLSSTNGDWSRSQVSQSTH
ncbi:MAG: PAS domain-containing protein [Sphingobium sp.]|uniref:sensor histidine kinase n=1 Tax=Sphingobium sp. TaxID=1912891 RepID=UPI0029BCA4CD|nr:PAS domain-containing protein [Sphingobium sp.]MDX3910226.1 PAS domain-containing protein [Sphingobium sp.]